MGLQYVVPHGALYRPITRSIPEKNGFHLSAWDFADSLGQLPLVDGHELRHIRDGIAV